MAAAKVPSFCDYLRDRLGDTPFMVGGPILWQQLHFPLTTFWSFRTWIYVRDQTVATQHASFRSPVRGVVEVLHRPHMTRSLEWIAVDLLNNLRYVDFDILDFAHYVIKAVRNGRLDFDRFVSALEQDGEAHVVTQLKTNPIYTAFLATRE